MQSTHHSCQILMKLEFSQQIFGKNLKVKFHENLSSGSRFVSFGRMDDGQTDRHMTKLIVTLRNYANAPKIDRYKAY